MFNHLVKSVAIASLSVTLLFAASPLAAAETQRIAVQSSDLNLAKGADRTKLQQRIAHAVDRICGSAHTRSTADLEAYATCSKTAQVGAEAQFAALVAKAQTGTRMAGEAMPSAH